MSSPSTSSSATSHFSNAQIPYYSRGAKPRSNPVSREKWAAAYWRGGLATRPLLTALLPLAERPSPNG